VRLPDVNLDDRTFQELVNEARLRIAQSCPEWTEHNVSDPGITLIELFAWMTEMLIYRTNRIPDKLHVELLNLLGIRLIGPAEAHCDVRFSLSAPTAEPVVIPGGVTEVGTLRTTSDEAIIFTTSEDVTIPPERPVAYAIERHGGTKDIGVAGGVARPKGPDQLAFSNPPAIGDAIYLGFAAPLSRLLLRVDVDCSQARGAGVDPEDPPLRWEVSTASGWAEAIVLEDHTGGFNYGSGAITLDVPDRHDQLTLSGNRCFWLRCRCDTTTRAGRQAAAFTAAPEIYSITAAPVGATITAANAAPVSDEDLGASDGTPGQQFTLRSAPVLKPAADETLEVRDPLTDEWQRWQLRGSFAESGPDDPHYLLDLTTGTVELGPAVRSRDGGWRQYGAVPAKGATLRFTRYRHGGGRRGNVAAGALSVLKTAVPGVATVTNPRPAVGGVDAESLASARERAALDLRTRDRAVTATDYEFLSGQASPQVARAICVAPLDGGPVRVRLVPRVEPADRQLRIDELTPDDALFAKVAVFLDERRMIGTSIELLPVRYRGVSVVVNVQASVLADLHRVETQIERALYTYLNPLVGGSQTGAGAGWEFGRPLNQGELYGIVHNTPGVEHVRILRVYETDLDTGKQEPKPAGAHLPLAPDELIASGKHIVKAEHPDV
jgi:predicted phage baseplate assembly protein